MSAYAKYRQFTKIGGTGTQIVTGFGFRPKLVILVSSRQSVFGPDDKALMIAGMTDSVNNVCNHIHHPDNEAATTSGQTQRLDAFIYATNATSGAGPTTLVAATCTGFTSDGFVLNFTVNDGLADIYHAIAIGGSDVQVDFRGTLINVNAGGDIVVNHGLSGTPDCFMMIGQTEGGSYVLGAPWGSIRGFGFSDGSTNLCGWTLGRGTGGASDNNKGQHTDRCATVRTANLTGAGDLCSIQITAKSATTYTIHRTVGSTAIQPTQYIFAIRGISFALGSFNVPGAPGDYALNLGVQPDLLVMETHGITAATADGMSLAMGFWDRAQQLSGGIWIGGNDNTNPSVYARDNYTDVALQHRTASATGSASAVNIACTVKSSSSAGVVLNFSSVASAQVIYIAFAPTSTFETPFIDGQASNPLTWDEYTDRNGLVTPRSEVDLCDPLSYHYGYKKPSVLRWDPISYGLSDRTGQIEHARTGATHSDADRTWRALLAGVSTKYFTNRPGTRWMVDDEDRRRQALAWLVACGYISDYSPKAGLQFYVTFSDWLKKRFTKKRTGSQSWQPLITEDDFPNCNQDIIDPTGNKRPNQAGGKAAPLPYGKLSDSTPVTVNTPAVRLTRNPGIPIPWGAYAHDISGAGTLPHGRIWAYVTSIKGTEESLLSNLAGTSVDYDRALHVLWSRPQGSAPADVDSYRVYFFDTAQGYVSDDPTITQDSSTFIRFVTHDNTTFDSSEGGADFEVIIPDTSAGTDYLAGGTTTTSVETGKGLVKPIYVGDTTIGGTVYRTGLICRCAISDIVGGFLDGVPIDLANHPDWLTWKNGAAWSGAGFSQPYTDINGRRYTVVYLKGAAGDALVGFSRATPAVSGGTAPDTSGVVFNIHGIESDGDGGGAVLVKPGEQMLHLLNNFIAPVTPYQSGTYLQASDSTFEAVPDLPLVDDDTFSEVDLASEDRLAGGYETAGIIGENGELVSAIDALARICVSGDFDYGWNRKWQMIASREPIAPVTGLTPMTDVVNIVEGSFEITDQVTSEFFNIHPYVHSKDPSGRAPSGWKVTGTVRDVLSISLYDQEVESPKWELHFVRSENAQQAATAEDVLLRKLFRFRDPRRKVTLRVPLSQLQAEPGDVISATHFEGIGANGWAGHQLRPQHKEVDPNTNSILFDCYDLELLFSGGFILGDRTVQAASWPSATGIDQRYGYLADRSTSKFSNGAIGKTLR